MSARASRALSSTSSGPTKSTRLAQLAAQRRPAAAGRSASTRWRARGRSSGSLAQRAQEGADGRALLVGDEHQLGAARVVVGEALVLAARRVGAGQDHAVVGREPAAELLARRLVGGDAGVEAAEEQLDDAARDLRREDALGRRVERADVERARVAQRGARGARRERLVDVREVERRDREELLDRAGDVDRQRDGALARGLERQHLADAEQPRHAVAGAGQQLRRIVGGGPDRSARGAHERGRLRRRDDQDPMAARGQLVGDAGDVSGSRRAALPRRRA